MTKRLVLILVALAVIPILILLAALALWGTSTSTRGGPPGSPIFGTPVREPSTPWPVTPRPAVAAIPVEINPDHLKLPPDAKLATVDEVVEYARVWAKQDGASSPRLVAIHLETLKSALEANYQQVGTDPSEVAIGHSAQELRRPVWRIFFGGTYHIPSCPAPVNSATPDNCGTTTGVEYIIDAITGSDYAAAYGANPLPAATP